MGSLIKFEQLPFPLDAFYHGISPHVKAFPLNARAFVIGGFYTRNYRRYK